MRFLFAAAVLFAAAAFSGSTAAEEGTSWWRARASWYGYSPELDGQPMANGAIYDPEDATVAATPLIPGTTIPVVPLGTAIRLHRLVGAPDDLSTWEIRTADAVIQDTCPGCGSVWPWRIWIDLSPAAFRQMGRLERGILTGLWLEVLP